MSHYYGSMRIDPVSSVQHLNDPLATAEARLLQTLRYLVYLHYEHALPFPDMPWFCYMVSPIGPGLRPPEAERAITPDMCVPIYPNEDHPTGRAALRTKPDFPFSNCYHWTQFQVLDVRVRAKPGDEVFDATHAIELPVKQHMYMMKYLEEDQDRVDARLKRRRKKTLALANVEPPSGEFGGAATPYIDDSHSSSLSSSQYSDASGEDSNESGSEDSADSLAGVNVFGTPEVGGFEYPVVDFSFDVQATLSEDYSESYAVLTEGDALQGIIRRPRDRFGRKSEHEGSLSGAVGPISEAQVQSLQKERHGRPHTAMQRMRRLRLSAATCAGRVCHAIRLPYLVMWP